MEKVPRCFKRSSHAGRQNQAPRRSSCWTSITLVPTCQQLTPTTLFLTEFNDRSIRCVKMLLKAQIETERERERERERGERERCCRNN